MIVDAHAHFLTEHSGRSDWQRTNDNRLAAGDLIGVGAHIASILGTWGQRSPTYFPSPDDLSHANDRLMDLMREHRGKIQGYCTVNPNFPGHAMSEIARCLDQGMIGIKLAASRRADDALLDPIADCAASVGAPILQHIWQRRRRDWPGQEASDATELALLAIRHPATTFILAHIGGGGDWLHSLRAVHTVDNIVVDLSGSGVDTGMLEATLEAVGVDRMIWGSDVTMDTGLAKLRHLRALGVSDIEFDRITHGTAAAIFSRATFP